MDDINANEKSMSPLPAEVNPYRRAQAIRAAWQKLKRPIDKAGLSCHGSWPCVSKTWMKEDRIGKGSRVGGNLTM